MATNKYTVTMTGTFFVSAESSVDAEGIVSEALLRINEVDARISDTETHWFDSVIIDGYHSTIVRDDEIMSDYDKQIFQMKYRKVTQ